MSASGTGRFIADSWFSGEPLPLAYTHPPPPVCANPAACPPRRPTAPPLTPTSPPWDIPAAIHALSKPPSIASEAANVRERFPPAPIFPLSPIASKYVGPRHGNSGQGQPRAYERCGPRLHPAALRNPSDPIARRERVAELLGRGRLSFNDRAGMLAAVGRLAQGPLGPLASIRVMARRSSPGSNQMTASNLVRTFPVELHSVPRANIEFCPSRTPGLPVPMNYLGAATARNGAREI